MRSDLCCVKSGTHFSSEAVSCQGILAEGSLGQDQTLGSLSWQYTGGYTALLEADREQTLEYSMLLNFAFIS